MQDSDLYKGNKLKIAMKYCQKEFSVSTIWFASGSQENLS